MNKTLLIVLAVLAAFALADKVCLEQQLDGNWMFVDCDKPCAEPMRCVSFPPLRPDHRILLSNKFDLQQMLLMRMLEDYYSGNSLRDMRKIAVCTFSLTMAALLLLFVDNTLYFTRRMINLSAAVLILFGAYVVVFV